MMNIEDSIGSLEPYNLEDATNRRSSFGERAFTTGGVLAGVTGGGYGGWELIKMANRWYFQHYLPQFAHPGAPPVDGGPLLGAGVLVAALLITIAGGIIGGYISNRLYRTLKSRTG